MGLIKALENMEVAIEKKLDYIEKSQKDQTTIMHSEVYSTLEEAQKANENVEFRAYYSSQKEFSRRSRGI